MSPTLIFSFALSAIAEGADPMVSAAAVAAEDFKNDRLETCEILMEVLPVTQRSAAPSKSYPHWKEKASDATKRGGAGARAAVTLV
jgi:hypothetical protein